MKTLEELIAQNERDKHALDLITLYLNYIGNHNDIQNRLIEAGEPVGSETFRLMDEQNDAFRNLWLDVVGDIKINDLSGEVWFRFFKLRHDVRFNS